MKFTIDPWDPTYGSSVESELMQSAIEAEIAIEVEAELWAPRDPPAGTAIPDAVVFVDGVRRVEARAWIEQDETAVPGIFASYAAGAVRCDGVAKIVDPLVARGLFAPGDRLGDIETRHGRFVAFPTDDATPQKLMKTLLSAMADLEVQVAERARRAGDELLLLDGPLKHRRHVPHAVGIVKTHDVKYLEPAQDRIVGALESGQRTPVFRVDAQPFSRYSWYVRLPGPPGGPWAGIVRCEATGALAPRAVVDLADTVTAVLPPFASAPHKDARAPQNLYPIGGLERDLRHRLGDAGVVYRALRRASGAATSAV
ncbi:MAG TPA: hypothetical protein VIK54_08550 [Acidimicrobiia bacterium]